MSTNQFIAAAVRGLSDDDLAAIARTYKPLRAKVADALLDGASPTPKPVASAGPRPVGKARAVKPAGKPGGKVAAKKAARAPGEKRAPAELDALTERLFEAVRAIPGSTAEQLAAKLGLASTKELNVPRHRLEAEKRIVGQGQKRSTRYYVAGEKALLNGAGAHTASGDDAPAAEASA